MVSMMMLVTKPVSMFMRGIMEVLSRDSMIFFEDDAFDLVGLLEEIDG